MTSSTHLIRLTRVLLVGALTAGAGASIALAAPMAPDGGYGTEASYSTPQGLRADGLRLQAIARAYQQSRGISSAVQTTHSTPQGLTADGLRLQAIAHTYQQSRGLSPVSVTSGATSVSRPPDVSDAAESVGTVSVSQSGGFDWADWGIGIGSGMGAALLLAIGLVTGRQRRHRVQTA